MYDEFFLERQGAAILKHGVLGRYLRYFASKTGRYAPGNRVVYVDGYAGPGLYADGNAGSPLIAAQVHDLVDNIRELDCTFVEADPDHAAQLEEALADAMPDARVFCGEMETHIGSILRRSQGLPMLAFIDPFGLGLSFHALERLTTRQQPTDIILNVSLSAVRRFAGHLTSPKSYRAKAAFVEKLDVALGGDWWQQMWIDTRDADAICNEFCHRCASLRGYAMWTDIHDRWGGPTVFYLLLISGHPDAHEGFIEFMSLANDELREADPRVLSDDELLLPLKDEWISTIARNVEQNAEGGSFVVRDRIGDLYGSTLGYARKTHLRAAIKAANVMSSTATGEPYNWRISPV